MVHRPRYYIVLSIIQRWYWYVLPVDLITEMKLVLVERDVAQFDASVGLSLEQK